jgi:acyl carrier protein
VGSELTINDEIALKIKQVLAEVFNDGTLVDEIGSDADLIEEYGLDSLQTISFLLKTEDTFDIQLDFENLPRPRTPSRAIGPARAGRRVAVESRGRVRRLQGARRPGRTPGPHLDLLAPLDHPGPARPCVLVRPGPPGRAVALVPVATPAPGHCPELPLPPTSPERPHDLKVSLAY